MLPDGCRQAVRAEPGATTAAGESNGLAAVPPLRYGRSGDSPAAVADETQFIDGRRRPSRERDRHRPRSRAPPLGESRRRATHGPKRGATWVVTADRFGPPYALA